MCFDSSLVIFEDSTSKVSFVKWAKSSDFWGEICYFGLLRCYRKVNHLHVQVLTSKKFVIHVAC